MRTLRYAVVALLLLGCAYWSNGIFHIATQGSKGSDLLLRWNEGRNLLAGVNPYDLSGNAGTMQRRPAEVTRLARHGLADAPATTVSGYPAWGLATSLAMVPPVPFALATAWYIGLSLIAMAIAMRYAFRIGARHSVGYGWLFAVGVFAMAGNASTLRLGQYGLILNAALILAWMAAAQKRPILAGAALFIAAIKPTYSLLQFGVILFRNWWIALAVTALLCIAGALLTWSLTGADPIEMTWQLLHQSPFVAVQDTSMVESTRGFLPHGLRFQIFGVIALVLSALISWQHRHHSVLVAASAAAILGRLLTYHRQYDNVMLVFPLVALAAIALASPSRGKIAIALIFAVSLWLPLPLWAYTPSVILLLSIIWISGCITIIRNADVLTRYLDEAPR